MEINFLFAWMHLVYVSILFSICIESIGIPVRKEDFRLARLDKRRDESETEQTEKKNSVKFNFSRTSRTLNTYTVRMIS